MAQQNEIFPNLESIASPFAGILLDAYGVFWGGNGVGMLPGCKDTMQRLVASGKIVGILSNNTVQAEKEINKLKTHGLLQGEHFHFLITSGTVANRLLVAGELPFPTPNRTFFLTGTPHPTFNSHPAIFQNSHFEETSDLKKADFIFISVPHIDGKDQINPELFKAQVEVFKDYNLPMLCVNPDRFAHEGMPPQVVVRQGSIARMYEEQGGQVFYVGKPSGRMYSAAMESFQQFGISDPKTVLMVGDTPETDVQGAKDFGMPSALIMKTGMMSERVKHHGLEYALQTLTHKDSPEFFIEYMGKNEL